MDKTFYTMVLRHYYNQIRARLHCDHDLSRVEVDSTIAQLCVVDEELQRVF